MPKNDWNQLGNDIKNIVQDAIETGDYGRLNRDLGVTLENALGNMATSVKDAAIKNLNHFSGSQQTVNQRNRVEKSIRFLFSATGDSKRAKNTVSILLLQFLK